MSSVIVVDQEQRLEKYKALMERLSNKEEKLSFSAFNYFANKPEDYIDYKLKTREERDETQTIHMLRGQVLHCLVLEPEEFESRYAVMNDASKPTTNQQKAFCQFMIDGEDSFTAFCQSFSTKGKTDDKIIALAKQYEEKLWEYIEFMKTVGDRKIISSGMHDQCRIIKERIYKNDPARWLLDETGHTECRINWEYGGFPWVGYIDARGKNIRWDLKIVPDASPRKLYYTIQEKRLHWQVGNLYGMPDEMKGTDAYILAVDLKGGITVARINDTVIHQQQEVIDRVMKSFKTCIFMNEWKANYDFWRKGRRGGIYDINDPGMRSWDKM